MKKEEAIFRLQIIDNYLQRQNDYSERDHDSIMMAIEALKERPHGEWKCEYSRAYCSVCNDFIVGFFLPNFCPNCGSDMRPKEGDE